MGLPTLERSFLEQVWRREFSVCNICEMAESLSGAICAALTILEERRRRVPEWDKMQNWVMERRLCHALLAVDRPRRARDEDPGEDEQEHRKCSKVEDSDDEMLCEHNDEGKRVIIILKDDEKAFERKRRK